MSTLHRVVHIQSYSRQFNVDNKTSNQAKQSWYLQIRRIFQSHDHRTMILQAYTEHRSKCSRQEDCHVGAKLKQSEIQVFRGHRSQIVRDSVCTYLHKNYRSTLTIYSGATYRKIISEELAITKVVPDSFVNLDASWYRCSSIALCENARAPKQNGCSQKIVIYNGGKRYTSQLKIDNTKQFQTTLI